MFYTTQNEVNAIKWDPSGMLLASCSDDMTLKVRNPSSEVKERKAWVVICIQSLYLVVAVFFTLRSGVWSRIRAFTTSRLTVKRSTPSSGVPQAPAQTTPTLTSCSPGGNSLTCCSLLKAECRFCELRLKQHACLKQSVWEAESCHSLAFRRNHVSGKISMLVNVSGSQPHTLTQMCTRVWMF